MLTPEPFQSLWAQADMAFVLAKTHNTCSWKALSESVYTGIMNFKMIRSSSTNLHRHCVLPLLFLNFPVLLCTQGWFRTHYPPSWAVYDCRWTPPCLSILFAPPPPYLWDRVFLFSYKCPRTHQMHQASLKLTQLCCFLSLECCDYSRTPPLPTVFCLLNKIFPLSFTHSFSW